MRPPPRKQPRCALLEGFSLHANTHLHANDRQGLERLCRYGARGALEVTDWREACAAATRCMVPPSIGGLGLTGWEDVGGLTRLEVVSLLTLAIQRLAHTPEVGAGPLFPGLPSKGRQ